MTPGSKGWGTVGLNRKGEKTEGPFIHLPAWLALSPVATSEEQQEIHLRLSGKWMKGWRYVHLLSALTDKGPVALTLLHLWPRPVYVLTGWPWGPVLTHQRRPRTKGLGRSPRWGSERGTALARRVLHHAGPHSCSVKSGPDRIWSGACVLYWTSVLLSPL